MNFLKIFSNELQPFSVTDKVNKGEFNNMFKVSNDR